MNETITIKGIQYIIVNAETPEDVEARGLNYVAKEMRDTKVTRMLGIRRPNGKKVYFCKEFNFYGNIVYNDPYPLM